MSGQFVHDGNRVFKYALAVDDLVTVEMPRGSRVIHVAKTDDQPHEMFCVWALVDPEAPPVRCTFAVVGTGHSTDGLVGWVHEGTWIDDGLVWHLLRSPSVEVIP